MFEAAPRVWRAVGAICFAALLGGCTVTTGPSGGAASGTPSVSSAPARPGHGGPPPAADAKVAPPTELTCGREGNADRCVVRVSVWMDGNTCQFSFAPDGLKIKGRLGPTQIRFVLYDVHNEGFRWVDPRGEPRASGPIEFQARDARGRWAPDPAADRAFPVAGRQVRGAELIVPTTNVRRAEPPGAERYPYILRVVRRGVVCESPDPWIWPGEP